MATTKLALSALFGNPAITDGTPIRVELPKEMGSRGSAAGAGLGGGDDEGALTLAVLWAARRK